MRAKTLPIFLTFFLMGLADAMGPMSDGVKRQYELSNLVATLLPFFVFIAFAVFSLPGGLVAARIGKKSLLLLGLGLNAVALLIPSLQMPSFALLLGCIFLLGVGTTFLQVAGNPIMRDVSAEGAYSRNLSFAQGIKGIGSTLSTYLITALATRAFFQGMGWRGAFPLFFVLMAMAFIAVATLKVEETKAERPPSLGTSLGLLKEPVFFLAVLGIFLYVGAESCMGRFLKPTLEAFGMDDQAASKFGPSLFFLLLTLGRLLGSAFLTLMNALTCFRISCLLGGLGAAALMTGSQALAIPGVVAAGLGFANIWPMLFSITVEKKPECASELSGLMCMAISGGALLPLLMGWFLDLGWQAFAFIVPVAAFLYLLLLSLQKGKKMSQAQVAGRRSQAAKELEPDI
jgi:FHS family L-fucose permease-like MFS transporter